MNLPDLLIPSATGVANSSGESLRNFERFLYKGATQYRADRVKPLIDSGSLGLPQVERIELIEAICVELTSRITKGDSPNSLPAYIRCFSLLLRFMEQQECSFQLIHLEENFLEFSEYLFIESKTQGGKYNEKSAYSIAATLSSVMGSILDIPDTLRLISRTRLRVPKQPKKALTASAEKQNLEHTFRMGSFLFDLTEGLNVKAIYGHLPVTCLIRDIAKDNFSLELWMGMEAPEWYLDDPNTWNDGQKHRHKIGLKLRGIVEDITGVGSARRWRFVNLRIQAEFLIFLAQTGMNSTQAKELKRGDLKYKLHDDGWLVRGYKNRKGGEVTFQIYKSYKSHFEEFRAFVSHFFPNSEYLFPMYRVNGTGESEYKYGLTAFDQIRDILKENNIPWIPPKQIRNTRINWILRRSGDESQTAEMAQHSVEILREDYASPSLQRAIVETTRFWNIHDPIRNGDLKASVIGSFCDGNPQAMTDKPEQVADPNCTSPSGCLWCTHHRDVDALDYVWSLASFRHLKTFESSMNVLESKVPAETVINRLTEKITWFENSSSERNQWVKEVKLRVAEGSFHPNWTPLINFVESL